MQNTTPRRSHFSFPRRAIIAHFSLVVALTSFAPGRASADSPNVIRGASTAVLAIRASLGLRLAPTPTTLKDAPEPAKTGFISEDLLRKATDIVNNGIGLGKGRGHGRLYVHVKPQGFGGVVTLRYRR
jgi:hypothetical protein